jgi:hypothetical protein
MRCSKCVLSESVEQNLNVRTSDDLSSRKGSWAKMEIIFQILTIDNFLVRVVVVGKPEA